MGLHRRSIHVATTLLAFAVAACAGMRGGSGARSAIGASCDLVGVPTATPDSVSVVLTWPIDPADAPYPANPAERFAFSQAYETLVSVDCTGRPRPGLAARWTRTRGMDGWRLVLRPDARWWNGEPVTAADVVAALQASSERGGPVPWGAPRVAAVDDSTIEVAGTDLETLGGARWTIARPGADGTWPEGTGAYRLTTPSPASGDERRARAGGTRRDGRRSATPLVVIMEPVSPGIPPLVLRATTTGTARDEIDAGADLVLTEDAALAAYAASRLNTTAIALPWSRTWTLLVPNASGELAAPPDASVDRRRAIRDAIARDAVGVESRGAEELGWTTGPAGCRAAPTVADAGPPPDRPTTPPSSRIAFSADEPTARALAERLAALAGMARAGGDSALSILAPPLAHRPTPVTSVSLSRSDLASALRARSVLGVIVSLPRAPVTPCDGLTELATLAPWTVSANGTIPGGTVVPLVDTRTTAIVRRDRIGLTALWNGAVRVTLQPPTNGPRTARP